ncbi:MAG: right-handed parallel beta-helix repeat-containing protein [Muribaculaceae bacterium]|nr:right-handed parallel beta-helix repeat-containing protein [Muribaculaceae bacterium]
MKKISILLLALAAMLPARALAQEQTDTITIWMAGDSTMANKQIDDEKQERGWGQMLPLMLQGPVKVSNHAVNGQSSKSFIDSGRWDKMMAGVKKGDYVIIQFGHNDEKIKSPERYSAPGSTFDDNLTKMVKDVKKKGATPILMNSIVRRNFPTEKVDNTKDVSDHEAGPTNVNPKEEGTRLVDTHGAYLESPRNVAKKQKVTFIDFNASTHNLVQYLGTEKSKALYMHIPAGKYSFCPKGKIDNTHLNIYGATVLARLAADSLAKRIPELAVYIIPQENAREMKYVVTDLAVYANDSTKLQTQAIQNIIDIAEANGGGQIIFPAGTYLTGALFFKPGTRLHLEKGAKIKGSDDIDNFPLIPSRMEGKSIYYYAALINAYFVKGFEITGEGTIDGNGYNYWMDFWTNRDRAVEAKRKWTNLEAHRPRLVFLWGCNDLKISGVNLQNSPFWTTHLYMCDDVLIENCRITAPRGEVRAPSSDALDLDACRRVVVRNCYLNCDDDGVCLKGGKGVYANRTMDNGICEDILVENCEFGRNLHGVLTLGSECIHAKNVTVRNCKADINAAVLRLKMRPDTYQIYENVLIENITGTCGTVMDMKPWKQFFTLEGSNEEPYGIVRDITIRNVDVNCNTLCHIQGNPADQVSNILFDNVKVEAKDPSLTVVAYPEVKFKNVTMNGKSFSQEAERLNLPEENEYDKL